LIVGANIQLVKPSSDNTSLHDMVRVGAHEGNGSWSVWLVAPRLNFLNTYTPPVAFFPAPGAESLAFPEFCSFATEVRYQQPGITGRASLHHGLVLLVHATSTHAITSALANSGVAHS
jgi:hypothetical protein